ncbi:hypothetical protein D920_02738 [Enterococcus faecalis 13-SD-W-01]|nr:hypothetical protein D920_02738 [Enterococcus faecalis 13-SD-W-01]
MQKKPQNKPCFADFGQLLEMAVTKLSCGNKLKRQNMISYFCLFYPYFLKQNIVFIISI